MKKLFHILIAATFLLALVPAAVSAHTENDPLVVDLLAGQTEDIGDVEVWNDAENLYVKFVYDETLDGCGFLEVHLQVDEDSFSPDILTKKGNPIPGQFEKSFSGGCFKEHTFTYNLAGEDFAPGDNLWIAAHAALGREEAMAIVSGDGQTKVIQRRSGDAAGFTSLNQAAVLAWEPGPNYPNDGPDDSSWEANSLWDQRLSTDLRPTGADWIWESYQVLDPEKGTVLTFQRPFDIGYPIDGSLLIACDNGYEVFLNGTSLGSDNVYSDWRTSNLKQAFVDVNGWDTVGSFALLDYLLDGANVLTIDAANEYFNTDDSGNPYVGTVSSNPGACIFAMDVDYYADGETAWGCGDESCFDFDGKNWATYFMYTVQEPCTNVPEVLNGNFETPEVTTTQGWDIFPYGTANLGWTVEWVGDTTSWGGQTRPTTAVLELHRSGTVVPADEGNQYAELDTDWGGPGDSGSGEPASVAISQNLETCSGDSYTLEFAWNPRTSTSKMEVFWGNTSLGTFSSGSGWTTQSINVTADSESMLLKFVEIGPEDSYGMFLDDVKITGP